MEDSDTGQDTHVYGGDPYDSGDEAESYDEGYSHSECDSFDNEMDQLSVEEMYDFLNKNFRSAVSGFIMGKPVKLLDGRFVDLNDEVDGIPVQYGIPFDSNWTEAETALMNKGTELSNKMMERIYTRPLQVTDERLKMYIEGLIIFPYNFEKGFVYKLKKRDFLTFFRILDETQTNGRLQHISKLRHDFPENCTLDDEVAVSDLNLALYFIEKANKFTSVRTGRLVKWPYSNSEGEVIDEAEVEQSDEGLFHFNPALNDKLQDLIFEGVELLGMRREFDFSVETRPFSRKIGECLVRVHDIPKLEAYISRYKREDFSEDGNERDFIDVLLFRFAKSASVEEAFDLVRLQKSISEPELKGGLVHQIKSCLCREDFQPQLLSALQRGDEQALALLGELTRFRGLDDQQQAALLSMPPSPQLSYFKLQQSANKTLLSIIERVRRTLDNFNAATSREETGFHLRKGCIHTLNIGVVEAFSVSPLLLRSEVSSLRKLLDSLASILNFYFADYPELSYEEYIALLEQRNAEAALVEAEMMRLQLEITQKEVEAFSKPANLCWVYYDRIYRTRSVGSKLEVSQLMSEWLSERAGNKAYSNEKISVWKTQRDELFVVDCKRDFSQFSIGPIPFKLYFHAVLTSLKNRVFFIVPIPSKPSGQFDYKVQEWKELPQLPVFQREIGACTVEVTEKLYVYQLNKDCNFIQELDLNSLSWRLIHLPFSVILKYYPIYFPGGSSLILVNGDAEVIRIDPEQATVSKVGDLSPCYAGIGFVHEGKFIQHISYSYSRLHGRMEGYVHPLELP